MSRRNPDQFGQDRPQRDFFATLFGTVHDCDQDEADTDGVFPDPPFQTGGFYSAEASSTQNDDRCSSTMPDPNYLTPSYSSTVIDCHSSLPTEKERSELSSMDQDRKTCTEAGEYRPNYLTLDENGEPIAKVWRGIINEGAYADRAGIPEFVTEFVEIQYPNLPPEESVLSKKDIHHEIVVYLDRRYFGKSEWPYTQWIKQQKSDMNKPTIDKVKILHFNQHTKEILWGAVLPDDVHKLRGWRFPLKMDSGKKYISVGTKHRNCTHDIHSRSNPCVMVIADGTKPDNESLIKHQIKKQPTVVSTLKPSKKKGLRNNKRSHNGSRSTDSSSGSTKSKRSSKTKKRHVSLVNKSDILEIITKENVSEVLDRLTCLCQESKEVQVAVSDWYHDYVLDLIFKLGNEVDDEDDTIRVDSGFQASSEYYG